MSIEITVYHPGTGSGARVITCDAKHTVDDLRAFLAKKVQYSAEEMLLSIQEDEHMKVLPNGKSLQECGIDSGKINVIECRKLPAPSIFKLNNPGMQGLLQNSVLRQNSSASSPPDNAVVHQQSNVQS